VGQNTVIGPPIVTKLYLIREHRLHGIVTGMEGVQIMSSPEDKLDRLLVSFKDAKVSGRECTTGSDHSRWFSLLDRAFGVVHGGT